MVDQPTFGDTLKRARQTAGLTQEALAARAGVSARAISDLERGVKHVPRRDTVRLLVAALPLSAQEHALFEASARRLGDPTPPAAASGAGGAAGAARLPLVGQLHARAALARHLAGDGPSLLALTGEPGIGKTRLLAWAAERGAAQGLRVLQGCCAPGAGREPDEPLLDALHGYIRHRSPVDLRQDLRGCAWLVRVFPALVDGPIESLPAATLPPAQQRRLIAEAVARFLSNVAGPAGVLLVLDDLHGADAAALDLLTALLHSAAAAATPLRVVVAYRDTAVRRGDPLDVLLAVAARAQAATHLTLPRLGPRDAAHLLDALLGDSDTGGPRARVLLRADGVPFFLVEWARDLRAGGDTASAADRVPWAVTQSVRQRIDAAPAVVRTVLGVAAVVDGPVTPTLLLPWVADTMEVAEALDAAAHARLLRAAGDGYRFAHEVIRAVVAADLGPVRRAALRRRVDTAATRGGRWERDATDGGVTGGDRSVTDERHYHLAVLARGQGAPVPGAPRDADARPSERR